MAEQPPRPALSAEMLRIIHGQVPAEEKREQYRDSLHRCAASRGRLWSMLCTHPEAAAGQRGRRPFPMLMWR